MNSTVKGGGVPAFCVVVKFCVMDKDNADKRKERIYVCHTFYHVYVACLKELNLPEGGEAGSAAAVPEPDAGKSSAAAESASAEPAARTAAHTAQACGLPAGAVRGGATLVLSRMSNDFGDLDVRARACGLFEEVVWFDEKPFSYFDELVPLKEDTGSLPRNMINRMKFCRRFAELEEPYVPVDFAQYGDIYVFCDSDPIGYYLNYKKIRYHAVEDGLDCIRYLDTARVDNRGHFAFKARMAAAGLIFIQNGYAKYCIDMEVNDLSALDHPMGKMREVPRERLVQGLTAEGRQLLIRLFIANREELLSALCAARRQERPAVLILTEPLCPDLTVRKQLIEDMIEEYGTFEVPCEGCGAAAEQAESFEGETDKEGCRKDGTETMPAPAESPARRVQGVIVLKPHPRDLLDYRKEFPQHIVLDAKFPMEILNFLDLPGENENIQTLHQNEDDIDLQTGYQTEGGIDLKTDSVTGDGTGKDFLFERVVTVYTVPRAIHCAKEKVYLGNAFMDRYEDRSAHENVTDHGESVIGR